MNKLRAKYHTKILAVVWICRKSKEIQRAQYSFINVKTKWNCLNESDNKSRNGSVELKYLITTAIRIIIIINYQEKYSLAKLVTTPNSIGFRNPDLRATEKLA